MPIPAGMRYHKMLDLIEDTKEKRDKWVKMSREMATQRTAELRANYSGEAADAYEKNTNQIIEKGEKTFNKIIEDLTTEAERQHDAYKRQEENAKASIAKEA